MKRRSIGFVTCLCMALFPSIVLAQADEAPAVPINAPDLFADEITLSATAVPEIEIDGVGGFYLRTDIGVAGSDEADAAYLAGVGIGYRLSDLMRFDAALDYGSARSFERDFHCIASCPGGAPGMYRRSGDASTLTVLANAYVDIATIAGFTPYVGAGIGATWVSFGDAVFTGPNDDVRPADIDSDLRFTYGLMAGVSYRFQSVDLDLQYRYLDIAAPDSGAGLDADGLDSHQLRVGLRFPLY